MTMLEMKRVGSLWLHQSFVMDEIDSANEEPFWEPASAEDELKKQLQDITMSEDDLR